MSSAVSIATKSTRYTNATGISRRSTRSSKSSRRQQTTKADWRVVVRDTYANLFDVIGDWAYLYAVYHRDYDGDGDADSYLLNISFNYEAILLVMLGFCIMSTIFSAWTILTSLGTKCGKNSMCCNCTVPRLAMAGILFEDLPQFGLTTYIDFTFSGGLTPVGVMNICSSMTALINRATTRYDQILEEDEEDDDVSKLGTYEAMS